MTTRFSVQAAETSVKVVVIGVTTTGANHPVVSVTFTMSKQRKCGKAQKIRNEQGHPWSMKQYEASCKSLSFHRTTDVK